MVLAAIGSVIFGLSSTYYTASIARLLVGISLSTIFVCIFKIVALWFKPEKFATLIGLTSFIGNVGGLLATTPFALLVLAVGWRNSYLYLGVVSLAVGFLIWYIVRDTPQEFGWSSPLPEGKVDSKASILQGLKDVMGNIYTWLGFIMLFGTMGTVMSFSSLWGGTLFDALLWHG